MLVMQPNGLFCIYDEFKDQPVAWNITKNNIFKMQWIKRKEKL